MSSDRASLELRVRLAPWWEGPVRAILFLGMIGLIREETAGQWADFVLESALSLYAEEERP